MVIMESAEGKSLVSLEELALKRKERLKNLKRKAPGGDNSQEGSVEIIVPLPKPKFRSYKPQDESLKEAQLEDAEPAAVEDEVKDLLEAGKEKPKNSALTKEEVLHLLNLVESNPITYSRTTSTSSNKLKDAAWVQVTNHFNSTINSRPRKPEQLRLKWENLKKNARKRTSNISLSKYKSGFGVPDYVQPDEILDKVASILGPYYDGYSKQSSDGGDMEESDDLNTVVVIPSPSDEEEIPGPIECVEVGVGGEAYPSGIGNNTSTSKDQRKRTYTHRTSGKSVHQNLMASEVDSRIFRNNAIAEYYIAKKKKIDEEIVLNTELFALQKKKVELEMQELRNKKGSIMEKDKLLLEKKQVELEILEIQRKKYSAAASLFRAASESI